MKTTKKWNKLFLVGMLGVVLAFGLMVVMGCEVGNGKTPGVLHVKNISGSQYAVTNTLGVDGDYLYGFSILSPGQQRNYLMEDNGSCTIYYHQYNGTLLDHPNANTKRVFYVSDGESETVNIP
jgi:hypothetical protein